MRLSARPMGRGFAALALAGLLFTACGTGQERPVAETSKPSASADTQRESEVATTTTSGGPDFPFTSPAFETEGSLPAEFTCEGEGASPPLEWSGLPEGTAELTLIVSDTDVNAYGAAGYFTHWVVYGIDPEAQRFPRAAIPDGALEGENSHGATGWAAPCPPPTDGPHTYRFTLFALARPIRLFGDEGRTPRPGEDSVDILYANTYNNVLGDGVLVATYDRN